MMFVQVATLETIALFVANVIARLWVMIGMVIVTSATIVTTAHRVGKLNPLLSTVKLPNSKARGALVLNLKQGNAPSIFRCVAKLPMALSMTEVFPVWSLSRPFCRATKGYGQPVDFVREPRIRVLGLTATVGIICILTLVAIQTYNADISLVPMLIPIASGAVLWLLIVPTIVAIVGRLSGTLIGW
jgi:hypothetical protein